MVAEFGTRQATTVVAQATFTKIQIDPACTTKYGEPEKPKGHYVAIGMDVATTPVYVTEALGYPSGHDFAVIAPDGFTNTNVYASDRCIADRDNSFTAPLFHPASTAVGY